MVVLEWHFRSTFLFVVIFVVSYCVFLKEGWSMSFVVTIVEERFESA